jgi:hypothetical protein
MQQASTGKPPNDSDPSGNSMPLASMRNRFVINLCGSTTPVALTPPDHAGLKRFTFFVSRRREDGRERFRLHMGYFSSQEEAERLLDIVREIYPGAWAGLAPGQRLRAQAEAAAAANQEMKESPLPAPPAADAPMNAAPAASIADAATPVPAAAAESAPPAATAPTSIATPTATQSLSLVPDEGRRVSEELLSITQDNEAAARALSNVRAAIASLEDSTTTTPTLLQIPELKAAVPAKPVAAAVIAPAPAPAVAAPVNAAPVNDLSETAALHVLESTADTASASTVRQPALPTTDDVAARKSASSTKPRDEKTAFAVQLLWSVQPIDIAQIPQLAIFSAYTLYGAEGNRDGRRWYGVRLGFFTDAVSAKQVAHYVRSDFSTVSVVPVTVRERERAKLAATRPDATPVAAAPAPSPAPAEPAKPAAGPGFEFIEDKKPAAPAHPAPAAASAPTAADAPHSRAPRVAPGKRAKLRPGRAPAAVRASKPRTMTLEETLEILGAGELKMDDGRRALINNDAAARAAAADAKGKPSRFGRLLERLSERLGS